ncbi:hypothetical protein Agub_g790 [Astrephomene gubernaculifera]|uniref:Uncharacterized protein n=1 Tax=Astrephomene gubernaculifera TaxID=47775 RepID=A0AAD3DGG1_9CHLO|nr:hypothetical protein Agub_g790 [Astrephomene gubernaculifera]
MASHTFCRAKPQKQRPCSASEALTIVQELLANGISSLPDDVRSNLYNVETELEVLKGFSEDLTGAARQQPAATLGTEAAQPAAVAQPANVAQPAAAGVVDKKERRKDKKHKDREKKGTSDAGAKEHKKEKERPDKRKAEGSAYEDKEKRKSKKQKTAS